MIKIKTFLLFLSFIFLTSSFIQADETLTILTTFAETGSSSKTIKIMKDKLAEELDQNINIKFGSGSSSALEIINERGNENFIYISTIGVVSLLPNISPNFKFDPSIDTRPISRTTSTPDVLIIRSGLGINTIDQLIDYSRNNDEALKYSYIAPTSIHRLEFAGLINELGLNLLLDESLRGSANVMKAIREKNIDLAMTTSPYVAPLVNDGDAIPLLVAHPLRIEIFPNVPTMLEYNLSSFPHGSWAGIFAPADISEKRIEEIYIAINRTLQDSQVKEEIEKLGMSISPSNSPNEFFEYIQEEGNRLKLASEKYNLSITD
tara:strand:+ start:107644 stop:108603 length:960 start_codon:yes stop_codon:yes gene_type:complete